MYSGEPEGGGGTSLGFDHREAVLIHAWSLDRESSLFKYKVMD